ncbi:MAG: DUF1292 domain-containing protein [Clostridia bacterium]
MSSDRNDDFLEDGVNTFTLTDDEGNEYEFELLDFVDLEERLYAVLIPSSPDDADEEDGIVIMETIFEGNEPVFSFVDDQALAQAVLNEYASRAEADEEEEE